MTNILKAEEWETKGDLELEPNAMKVVKSNKNYIVIAGPGAGKTELLAQRASFLLETNICPYPRKILAISFKKDAARNIAERVEARSGKEAAKRFVSKTYHAFAKMIMDHFIKAIPEKYRPSLDYDILTHINKDQKENIILQFENEVPEKFSNLTYGLQEINPTTFWNKDLTAYSLPFNDEYETIEEWLVSKVWDKFLAGNEDRKFVLTFSMIVRLAEYLLRSNPLILKALRATYSHVFLDEFQDTTYPQYDLLKTCFLGSTSVLTAVGDQKQRIMSWAGAVSNVFELFKKDFEAEDISLNMNHRSAPKLIKVQNVFAKFLSGETIDIKYNKKWDESDGICELWLFNDYETEAKKIADSIADWVEKDNINFRDICILLKQKPDKYADEIINELNNRGIKARNESRIQDILSEEISGIILAMINFSVRGGNSEDYSHIMDTLKFINGYDEETDPIKVLELENKLRENRIKLKEKLNNVNNKEELSDVIDNIINFYGKSDILAKYPQYRNKDWYKKIIKQIISYLWDEYEKYQNWKEAVASFCGEDTVPIMTIHKSKGLEFNTIFFVGLEDSAFWTIKDQLREDTSAFFVAFSRAKKRAIITFSKYRNFRRFSLQSRKNVGFIYQLLNEAKIMEIKKFE